jgi:hypothetical protein
MAKAAKSKGIASRSEEVDDEDTFSLTIGDLDKLAAFQSYTDDIAAIHRKRVAAEMNHGRARKPRVPRNG